MQDELKTKKQLIAELNIYREQVQKLQDEHKQVDKRLQGAYLELYQIFATAADGMRIIDKDYNMLRYNKKFLQLASLKEMDVVGKKCYEVFPGPHCHTLNCPLTRIKNGEQYLEYEVVKESQNGKKVPCILTATPFRSADGEFIVIVENFKDITYIKEKQAKQKRLIKQLERSNKELEHFAYVASHDLREPLRKITSFGQLLEESLQDRLTDDEKEDLGFMIDGAHRLQEMIDDLLSYSRLSTQAKPFEKVELNSIVEDLKKNILYLKLVETNGKIVVPEKLPQIYADPTQIRLLIQNLIANGLKYRKKDVPPEIIIRTSHHEDGFLKVEIEDNGIGIEEKYLETIFTMFKRLHSRGQYEGTGLGLAICKKIVERHDGEIGVKSTLGEGTVFWFTIPLATTQS